MLFLVYSAFCFFNYSFTIFFISFFTNLFFTSIPFFFKFSITNFFTFLAYYFSISVYLFSFFLSFLFNYLFNSLIFFLSYFFAYFFASLFASFFKIFFISNYGLLFYSFLEMSPNKFFISFYLAFISSCDGKLRIYSILFKDISNLGSTLSSLCNLSSKTIVSGILVAIVFIFSLSFSLSI